MRVLSDGVQSGLIVGGSRKTSATHRDEGAPRSATRMRCANSVAMPPTEAHLEIDAARRVLRFDHRVVRLTRTEYRLFAHLVSRPEAWVATAELIRDVLGTHHRPDTPIVRVHVHALRRKLGACSVWLESDPHRTLGYRWVGPVPKTFSRP